MRNPIDTTAATELVRRVFSPSRHPTPRHLLPRRSRCRVGLRRKRLHRPARAPASAAWTRVQASSRAKPEQYARGMGLPGSATCKCKYLQASRAMRTSGAQVQTDQSNKRGVRASRGAEAADTRHRGQATEPDYHQAPPAPQRRDSREAHKAPRRQSLGTAGHFELKTRADRRAGRPTAAENGARGGEQAGSRPRMGLGCQ